MPRPDEWEAITADPVYKAASPVDKANMKRVFDRAVETAAARPTPAPAPPPTPRTARRAPLVLQSQRDAMPAPSGPAFGRPTPQPAPPPSRPAPSPVSRTPRVLESMRDPARATLGDELRAVLPPNPFELEAERAARERRLATPPEPGGLMAMVRSARETLPAAAQAGLSSSLLADARQGVLNSAPGPRGVDAQVAAARAAGRPAEQMQPPLVLESARNPEAPAGLLAAVDELRQDPGRLSPSSPGFAEGVGAVAPYIATGALDPAGNTLFRGGMMAAGKVAQKAAPIAARAASRGARAIKRTADTPPAWTQAVQRLIEDEGGFFDPAAAGRGAKRALDQADDAFEAAGQRVGAAARRAGTQAMMGLNTAADAIGPTGQRLGDALHVPKALAERPFAAAGRVLDLKGRTGKSAPEWFQAAKHQDAATGLPTLDRALNGVRRAFISNYGMSPEQFAIQEEARVYGKGAADPLRELAVKLNKDRTGAEQHDIHWQATELTPPPGPIDAQRVLDAIEVRGASREADRKLVDVGALPQEVADDFDGRHLPRGYTKHWGKEAPSGWRPGPESNLGGYDRRGTEETMTLDELNRRNADLAAAGAGERWRVDNAHPDGVTVDASRDYTIAERLNWGEIRHVGSALQRKAAKVERDARAGKTLQLYAQPGAGDHRGAFAAPASQFRQPGSAGPLPPEREINGQRYVLLPKDKAKGSSVPKWGALADHYVRDDVAFHLWNEQELKRWVSNFNEKSMNNLWKKAVTLGNFPGYFVNNFFQNPLILERTGGSMADLPAAWGELAHNSMLAQRAEEAGVIRNGVLARELGAQLAHFNATLSSQHMHSGFTLSKQIFRAMNALKGYEQAGYNLAGASDDLYRMALLDGLMRREGKTFEEAAEIAKKAFYDSEAVTAPAAQLATTIVPFAKVFWWAADNEANAWLNNPGKAAYMDFLTAAMPVAMGYMLGKGNAQQDAEELAKYPHMRGHGNSLPLPNDGEGQAQYLDTSAWNLRNQFKPIDDTALPSVDLPVVGRVGYPRGLSVGGPLATAAQMYFNVDAFTGRPLVDVDADDNVISSRRGDFLRRNLAPGAVRNGGALYGAAVGETTANGNRVGFPAQLARTFGFKVNPVNVPEAIGRTERKAQADARAFGAKIKQRERIAEKSRANGDERKAVQMEREIDDLVRRRDQMQEAADGRVRRMEAGSAPPTDGSTKEVLRRQRLAAEAYRRGDVAAAEQLEAEIDTLLARRQRPNP